MFAVYPHPFGLDWKKCDLGYVEVLAYCRRPIKSPLGGECQDIEEVPNESPQNGTC